jgi:hypothetical protein
MSGNVEDAQANETALELLQRFDQALAQAISQGLYERDQRWAVRALATQTRTRS